MLNFLGRCVKMCYPQTRSHLDNQSLSMQPKAFDEVPEPLNYKFSKHVLTFQDFEFGSEKNRLDSIKVKPPHTFKINNKDVLFIPVRHIQLLRGDEKSNEIKKIQDTLTNFLGDNKCEALLLEGFPIIRSITSRGRFSLDEKLNQLDRNQNYDSESDVAIHYLAKNNKIGDIYSAEPDDAQVITHFLNQQVEKKFLVAYFIFRNLDFAINKHKDFDSFIDSELFRLNENIVSVIKKDNLTEMAQSILNNKEFEFNLKCLNQKHFRESPNYQALIQCAQPPKYPQIHDDATKINDLANNVSHFRDINLLTEINHATKTYGEANKSKIVVMYGAQHFTTLFPALKILASSNQPLEEIINDDN